MKFSTIYLSINLDRNILFNSFWLQGYKAATPETMKHILDEYRKQRAAERQKPDLKMSAIPEEYKYVSDNEDDVDTNRETERVALDVGRKEEKWDCESIISTYSNIYNHPKLIEEPSIKRKVGTEVQPERKVPDNIFFLICSRLLRL